MGMLVPHAELPWRPSLPQGPSYQPRRESPSVVLQAATAPQAATSTPQAATLALSPARSAYFAPNLPSTLFTNEATQLSNRKRSLYKTNRYQIAVTEATLNKVKTYVSSWTGIVRTVETGDYKVYQNASEFKVMRTLITNLTLIVMPLNSRHKSQVTSNMVSGLIIVIHSGDTLN
jgi:hypothetical protein